MCAEFSRSLRIIFSFNDSIKHIQFELWLYRGLRVTTTQPNTANAIQILAFSLPFSLKFISKIIDEIQFHLQY